MKLFLLFAALCVASVSAQLDGVGRGYDVKYGQVRAPLINYHYDDGQTWTNPITGNTTNVPDELVFTNNPSSLILDEIISINTISDYISTLETWHKMSLNLYFFGFAYSKEVGEMTELLQNDTNQVYVRNRDLNGYSITTWPMQSLDGQESSMFTNKKNSLPPTCTNEADRDSYLALMELFGSHYINDANYGGAVRYTISVADSLRVSHNETWIKTQLSLFVSYSDFKIGIGGGKAVSKDMIAKEFLDNMNSTISFEGGDVSIAEDSYTEWTESLEYKPTMLYPALRPLSDLFEAGQVRKCVEDAITSYLNTPDPDLGTPAHVEDRLEQERITAVQESPTVLGLDNGIGRGFDLITENIRAPLFLWHYDQGQTWDNPYLKRQERIPDELYLTNIPSNVDDQLLGMVNSWQQYQSQVATWSGVDAHFGLPDNTTFDMSFQKSRGEVEDYFHNGTHLFGYEANIVAYYQLDVWVGIADLHPNFLKMLELLPTDMDDVSSQSAYRKFLDLYGTHAVTNGQFGGQVNFTTVFDESLNTSHTSTWLNQQIDLDLTWGEINIGIKKGRNSSTDEVDHDYAVNSHQIHQCDGGDPTLIDTDDYETWVGSVANNPAMLRHRSKMVTIDSLVDDAAKAALIRRCLPEYVSSGGARVVPEAQHRAQQKALMLGDDLPLVQGLDSGIGRGYDIITETHRGPLYQWNYDYQNDWINPYTGIKEAIPDEMYITDIPSNTHTEMYGLVNSWESYEHTMSSWVGVDASYGVDGASLDLSFQRSRGETDGYFKNKTHMFGMGDQSITYYQLDVWFGMVDLNPMAQRMIDGLPTELSTDADYALYQKFFDAFGTHVLVMGQFGGHINFTTSFDESLIDTHSESWVSQQIGLDIKYQAYSIGINNGYNTSTEKVSHDYTQASEGLHFCEGGDPAVLDSDSYEGWMATIIKNPAVLMHQSKLIPISDIIENAAVKTMAKHLLVNYVSSGGVTVKDKQ